MGYPMTYRRVLARNRLSGDYSAVPHDQSNLSLEMWRSMQRANAAEWVRRSDKTRTDLKPGEAMEFPTPDRITAGDLRRLEQDQRDERHLAQYAQRTGLTPSQCLAVLDAFFDGDF